MSNDYYCSSWLANKAKKFTPKFMARELEDLAEDLFGTSGMQQASGYMFGSEEGRWTDLSQVQ